MIWSYNMSIVFKTQNRISKPIRKRITTNPVKEPEGFRARLVGSHFSTITAGNSKDMDWKIPNLQWSGSNKQTYFDGVEYYAKDSELGDVVSFQVVDVDGITYPAGTVLEEFATDLQIIPDTKDVIRLYKAKLIPGMYVRIKYTSTGSNDVKFICNMLRHLDANKDL